MKLQLNTKLTLKWVITYAIAMGFFEAAVVIYMRAYLYPQGFTFPLKPMAEVLLMVEVFREAATIVMLVCVAVLAAKQKWQRWGYFLIAFAVWDIFYYVFLKICINWPSSFLTWDVLFLIPITWVGSVITPVIIAVMMIFLGYLLVAYNQKEHVPLPKLGKWLLLIGMLVCIIAFTIDYVKFLLVQPHLDFNLLASQYIPEQFYWSIYFLGVGLLFTGIITYIRQKQKMKLL